jgi:signal transduction histidine kinase
VRRSLILTVAAVVSIVLLAMLVPMAVLVRSYALEDRLSRAALEVQATESVVSAAGTDKGPVSLYLEEINDQDVTRTTVLYPDGDAIGPDPLQDSRVTQSRETGRARVDDLEGLTGVQILVPVSQGGSSALPDQTPVVRVVVNEPGIPGDVLRAWVILALLGLVLLVGALVLADRLGRTFVGPIQALAHHTQELGTRPGPATPAPEPSGPPEVRELGAALARLVDRIELLLAREREAVADLSHRLRTPMTALRLRVDTLADTDDRARLAADLDDLQATVDQVVREARRSEREGLDPRTDAAQVVAERVAFWRPLAEDQGRPVDVVIDPGGPWLVRTGEEDLAATVDVLLDNVFSHTPEGAALRVELAPHPEGVLLQVEDAGPGLPQGEEATRRGVSGAGSTGLGLAIATRTAEESGGRLLLSTSDLGGACIGLLLGRA